MAHPHDGLIRSIASRVDNAVDLARVVLPPAIAALVDFDRLTVRDGRHVDEEIREQIVDLLYTLPLIGGGEAWLQVILEAQSQSDYGMPRRTFLATGNRWTAWAGDHADARELPMVVTVVISHDPRGWRAATDVREMVRLTPEQREAFGPWVPSAPFILFDLRRVDDAVLRGVSQRVMEATLLALKYSGDEDALLEQVQGWEELFLGVTQAPDGLSSLRAVMRYLHRITRREDAGTIIATTVKRALQRRVNELPEEDPMGDIIFDLIDEIDPTIMPRAYAAWQDREIERSRAADRRETLARLLRLRFDLAELPAWLAARIEAADGEALVAALDRVVVAERVEDVLPG